jgi:hypothetical protein
MGITTLRGSESEDNCPQRGNETGKCGRNRERRGTWRDWAPDNNEMDNETWRDWAPDNTEMNKETDGGEAV